MPCRDREMYLVFSLEKQGMKKRDGPLSRRGMVCKNGFKSSSDIQA